MKQLRVVLFAVLTIVSFDKAQAQAYWDYLMKPAAAQETLSAFEDARIIDIRSVSKGFDRGHIPGAVSIPFWDFRGEAGASGIPPSDETLTEMFRAAGLNADDKILIVHSGLDERSFAAASWVYWVMKSSGFESLAILDGGILAWRKAGLPMTFDVAAVERSEITVEFSDEWLATTADVARITSGSQKGTLLDSRADEVKDTSTISGAMSYAFTQLLEPSRQEAVSPVDMLERLKYADVDWELQSVVTFCNDGLQGAATWFMASEVVGIKGVKLYAESLQGWRKQETN